MINHELLRQQKKISELIRRTREACGDDLELQSHWAKYLCVMVAGFAENGISLLYSDFVKTAASEPVANFAARHIEKVQNPKASKFVEIAGSFKRTWGEGLTAFIDDNGRKDAIDSIMTNRHSIAHGQPSSITVSRVQEYFVRICEVVEYIESQFKT